MGKLRANLGRDYLIIDSHLVITDLHIGLEEKLRKEGYNFPQQDTYLTNKIKRVLKDEGKKIDSLIILGDVKETPTHFTKYERAHVSKFFEEVNKLFKKVIVVLGNHDGKLREVFSNPLPYYIYNKILFVHGHKRVPKDLLDRKDIEMIVAGHLHPLFKLGDKNGMIYYLPCWIRGKYMGRKIIFMPSFSDVVIGSHYVDKHPGPLANKISEKEYCIYDMVIV